MRYEVAKRASQIRKLLKEKFPTTKFSVRSQSYSGGDSIRIEYTDSVPAKRVEELVKQFESIDYDEMSGEILSGGNSFVFVEREISPKTAIERAELYNKLNGTNIEIEIFKGYKTEAWRFKTRLVWDLERQFFDFLYSETYFN